MVQRVIELLRMSRPERLSRLASRIKFLPKAQVMVINKTITVSLRRCSMTHSKLETSLDSTQVQTLAR